MIVTARAIAEYRNMLSRISARAADEVQQYMMDHHFEIDETFMEFVDSIVVKYGEAAGSLSAQFYDNLAEYWQIQNASQTFVDVVQKPLQIAEVADLPTEDEIAKAIYGTMKESPNKIPSTVGRLVKRTAEDTTLKNAIRDGAQFAWVPNSDTCPFCIMLASRGWQYASKKTLKNGHAEHIHPNCDCTYVVRFDSTSSVDGYDPDKYLEMYNEADGDLNAMRRKLKSTNDKFQRKPYDVTKEYMSLATPGRGTIDFDKGLNKKKAFEEKDFANLIHSMFGGDIHILNFKNYNGNSPDYVWNNELWDLKSPESINGIDGLVRKGLKQIEGNPGGIIINVKDTNASVQGITDKVSDRLSRKENIDIYVDIMVFVDGKFIKILRYR